MQSNQPASAQQKRLTGKRLLQFPPPGQDLMDHRWRYSFTEAGLGKCVMTCPPYAVVQIAAVIQIESLLDSRTACPFASDGRLAAEGQAAFVERSKTARSNIGKHYGREMRFERCSLNGAEFALPTTIGHLNWPVDSLHLRALASHP